METTTDSLTHDVLSAWHKYITTGRIDDLAVRQEIVESWERCRKNGVNPYAGRSMALLEQQELKELLSSNKNLIGIAKPFMANLHGFVSGSGFVVLLCDERGYILETVGDSDVINKAPDLNFNQGATWAEEEVGNNGVGTVQMLARPFQVSGSEHYCHKHHPWTCSGAPIFNEHKEMIGILEMSGPVEKTHLHTLGMVVAAVAAIENQMRVQRQNRELILLNNRMNNIFLTVTDGVIVVNKEGAITQINPVAARFLAKSEEDIRGTLIQSILERSQHTRAMLASGNPYLDLELTVNTGGDSINCLASGKPIKDDQGSVTGGVIFINPIKKIRNLINRFSGAHATFHFEDILGKNKTLLKAIQMASLAAGNDINVLLQGESGTGKEVFAQAIHNQSDRRNGPFVAVNCGAIPRELIGSELFGYVEGAFTGAQKGGRPGKFELASGGTLFLDEIGDMPLEQQVSLLRVLQDNKITRISGDKVIQVDVRIICASNKDLQQEVAKGNFRQDLYYRLNVISISLPPLRQHPEDITLMFDVFFKEACRKLGVAVPSVDPQVISTLVKYSWPGNVRQLQNVVERMINIANGQDIHLEHLPEEILSPETDSHSEITLPPQPCTIANERKRIREHLAKKDRTEIFTLLEKNSGNISKVARDLGISRNTLYRKMHRLNITV
jgi:PAS domain S-box-containing protein